MRISELWRYPVKSMAGERLERVQLTLDGIPGDRRLYVVDERERILSARTKPRLLGHHAAVAPDGEVLVDGLPWRSPEVAAAVEAAAGPGARLVEAAGNERFDILPLLVATDGAIEAFGHDRRRLRPNVVVSGVDGLTERQWQWRLLSVRDAVIALADLRERCIMTSWDPDSLEQDADVFRRIRACFDGTLALNAWAARDGVVAVGDGVRVLDEQIELTLPEPGRFRVTPGGALPASAGSPGVSAASVSPWQLVPAQGSHGWQDSWAI